LDEQASAARGGALAILRGSGVIAEKWVRGGAAATELNEVLRVIKPLNAATYESSLRGMLDALFRPVEDNGFWSQADGRILRALECTFGPSGRLHWRPDEAERYRYVPMALMGITLWRMSTLAHDGYDDKLRQNLAYYRDRLCRPDVRRAMPSYGTGPLIYAYSRLHELWPDEGWDDTAAMLTELALSKYPFRDNEDSLVLMGLSARVERLTAAERAAYASAAERLRGIQQPDGLYRTREYRTSFKHQNQMYTIWGLAHAGMALGDDLAADGIRRCLRYTVTHRMQPDGALLWHHYRSWVHRLYDAGLTLLGRVPEPIRLYSCHQAFFIYAVQVYRELSQDATAFVEDRDNALRWEYGQNVLGADLFERSGIGVPMRIMLTSGSLDVPTQRFIGVYEIGAMIMCMVSLLEELRREVPSGALADV
jgi:hypothetical protein